MSSSPTSCLNTSTFDADADADSLEILHSEAPFWNINSKLVLSPESTRALLDAIEVTRKIYASGLLDDLGMPTNVKGAEALIGHNIRAAIGALLIRDRSVGKRETINAKHVALTAILHDIGKFDPEIMKVITSDEFYDRDSPEGKAAFATIKRHPGQSARVIMEAGRRGFIDLEEAKIIAGFALYHHVRPDGKGYPEKDYSEVDIVSRLVSMADSWDVMRSGRGYQPAKNVADALAEVREWTGKQFDPAVAGALIEIVEDNGFIFDYEPTL